MIGPSHFGRGLKKNKFTPPPQGETRNSKVLADFVAYCNAHPQLRFWQALLNWSGLPFIVTSSHPPCDVYAETRVMGVPSERVELNDTYNWEGKNE